MVPSGPVSRLALLLALSLLAAGCRAWDRFSFEGEDTSGIDGGATDTGGIDGGGVDTGGIDVGQLDAGDLPDVPVADAPAEPFCDRFPSALVCDDFEGPDSRERLEVGGTCTRTAFGSNHAIVCAADSGQAASMLFPFATAPPFYARFRLRTLERGGTGYFEGAYLFDEQADPALVTAIGHRPNEVLLAAFDGNELMPDRDFASPETCVELHVEDGGSFLRVTAALANDLGRSTASIDSAGAVALAPRFTLKVGIDYNPDAGMVRVAVDDVVISSEPVPCD